MANTNKNYTKIVKILGKQKLITIDDNVFKFLSSYAKYKGISVNNLINIILDGFLEDNRKYMEKEIKNANKN